MSVALTYPEAIVIGFLQGVSELFPVSSLGHSAIIPALVGGQWAKDLSLTTPGSPYLATLVLMHVATAAAMVVFFWRDWVRIILGLVSVIRHRSIETTDERLAALLVIGTIPVGIAGLLLAKPLQDYLGKPLPAAIFLAINGAVLYAVEKIQANRKDDEQFRVALRGGDTSMDDTLMIPHVSPSEVTMPLSALTSERLSDERLSKLTYREAIAIGSAQIFALLPGISRSGITIVGGLLRGLKHEDAARFAFLLATPVILAAGIFKVPELLSPSMRQFLGPAVVGSIIAGVAAYFSLRFLVRYFETKTLTPFAIYCAVAGVACAAYFAIAHI
ncbi:MAG TPA: undecaprenyl-diphosphate phosphatase [Pseudonocardiaceae bacterium]